MRPRALDLFCGAGGATRGLQLAGFDVTGVDIKPQPHYCGERFVQADALTFPLEGYDFVWASPPCQAYTTLRHCNGNREYPDLIDPVRSRLRRASSQFAIENVEGAPLSGTLLCGTMFGLGASNRQLWRHRRFETSFALLAPSCAHRRGHPIGIYGTGTGRRASRTATSCRYQGTATEYREAMQMPWATKAEIAQAIPPAYAEYIGRAALAVIRKAA